MTAPLELVPTRITARRSWYVRVLTISSTCVCRTIPGCARWERSPRPVSVGVYMLCPCPASRGTSFFQHQPPNQAECTRTKSAISVPAAMTHSPLSMISRPGSVPGPRFGRGLIHSCRHFANLLPGEHRALGPEAAPARLRSGVLAERRVRGGCEQGGQLGVLVPEVGVGQVPVAGPARVDDRSQTGWAEMIAWPGS